MHKNPSKTQWFGSVHFSLIKEPLTSGILNIAHLHLCFSIKQNTFLICQWQPVNRHVNI